MNDKWADEVAARRELLASLRALRDETAIQFAKADERDVVPMLSELLERLASLIDATGDTK